MWNLMPSASVSPDDKFFRLEDVTKLARSLRRDMPLIRGRVWSGEERGQGWSIECDSFESFRESVRPMGERVDMLAYDEMRLDDETLRAVQQDAQRYAEDEGIGHDLVSKGISALRSHEGEMYSVVAYAFLASGHVIFVRAQTELSRYVYAPDRLLSSEGLMNVRKLKTLGH